MSTSASLRLVSGLGLVLILLAVCWADTLVQLHVNRPYNDVNENFVSFAVKPEDLYDILDGPDRKAVTRMAAMLGDSYVKLVGDYYFATTAPTRLRNPTKIIWKGFNRWTRAVNWTMIIPVPYAPDEWDSMHTLKILNSSYMLGITDCIWQLGTDFGTSRAKDYVQELNTLKLMTDTFKPYVDDWRVMGADISAGSSAEETKRYVEMSKDVNAAFGWTQPPNLLPATSLGSYIFDSDPALKVLQQQRVPLWLTLPHDDSETDQTISKRLIGDDTTDALRWAQTLGDAASSGFDVVFKKMSRSDFELPNFSFYVTALFKKVMGSRVFPARPLNVFAPTNKLYTHCANDMSGGLAFMVVNTEDQPTTITVRSKSRLASSDIWQYILTGEDGRVKLNNVKLSLNSTLRPLVKSKDSTKTLQLITPGMAVGFWVLPDVNLEHCQYTEIDADEISVEGSSEQTRSNGYSSADRLLQRLIEETSVPRSSGLSRYRRFVLDNHMEEPLLERLLQPLNFELDSHDLPKREINFESSKPEVRAGEAMAWLRRIVEQTRDMAHQRNRRSTDNYRGPYFYNKNGKKTTFTKKITEIRKPEKKSKPLFDLTEFDEEEFFKKLGEHTEPPAYERLPEGDVHLKHIETVDGEEEESEPEEIEQKRFKKHKPHVKKQLKIKQRSQEDWTDEQPPSSENERRKSRLVSSEFFEGFPAPKQNKRMNFGATLNSLLFPEPFSSKASMSKNINKLEEPAVETEADVEAFKGSKQRAKSSIVANDFAKSQRKLGQNFLSNIKAQEAEANEEEQALQRESSLEAGPFDVKFTSKKQNKADLLSVGADLFGDDEKESVRKSKPKDDADEGITSWWDLPLRRKRALAMAYSNEALRSNAIDRDDVSLGLGDMVPGSFSRFEYRSQLPTAVPQKREHESTIMKISKSKTGDSKVSLSEKIVTTVKSKVSRFVNIISRHMNEWYNTLARHLDTDQSHKKEDKDAMENSIRK